MSGPFEGDSMQSPLILKTSAAALLAIGSILGESSPNWASTLHVPSQYPTIQNGIDAAAFGDSVLVAPGIYTEYEIRGSQSSCAFLKDGVKVIAENGPQATTIDLIAITGFSRSAIFAKALSSDATVIDGFTIIGRDRGHGALIALCERVKVRNCIFTDFTGGAILAHENASIIDCRFVDCVADNAGAIWHTSGHINLIGCEFRLSGNTAVYLDQIGSTASARVENCQFIENWSNGGAGGLVIATAFGGAVVKGCLFKGNVNYGTGGGGLGLGQGSKIVEDCIFIENQALGPNGSGGGLYGGGYVDMIVRGNTFYKNSKTANPAPGAAVSLVFASKFENNIVVGSQGGPAVEALDGAHSVCNVYWDNPEGIGIPLDQTDREVDPMFCDPSAYDLFLQENSPCLPQNSLGCGLVGALGEGCGPVSVQSTSWGAIKVRYR